jgi:hypothetical protein
VVNIQVFSVYLVAFGLSWLIFLYFDIRRHQCKIRAQSSLPERLPPVSGLKYTKQSTDSGQNGKTPEQTTTTANNNNRPPSGPTPQQREDVRFNRHAYVFCQSRHSGSFYLKIGAAGKNQQSILSERIWKHRRIVIYILIWDSIQGSASAI